MASEKKLEIKTRVINCPFVYFSDPSPIGHPHLFVDSADKSHENKNLGIVRGGQQSIVLVKIIVYAVLIYRYTSRKSFSIFDCLLYAPRVSSFSKASAVSSVNLYLSIT
jgi:hypothetical protein